MWAEGNLKYSLSSEKYYLAIRRTLEKTWVPQVIASSQRVTKETEDWGDYKRLPEEIPEFPLIRRLLLGAHSVVLTPSLKTFETNERRLAKFSDSIDPRFVGRNAAVLQFTRFADVN